MVTIKKGILGGFSGKVGTVIGDNRKAVGYRCSLFKASSKLATQKQTDQRIKFAKAMTLLKSTATLVVKRFQSITSAIAPLYSSDGAFTCF